MYKKQKANVTSLIVNQSYIGERIEEKIMRVVNNKEPITDGAPIIYTDRKDGVAAEHNIRTDIWEIAVDAMDKVSQQNSANRTERHKKLGEQAQEGMKKESGAQSTHGTDGNGTSK